MKKVIFLESGHSDTDPGAISQFGAERDLNIAIRDELIPELKRQGFKVEVVPDNLNLRGSYQWVNKRAKNINSGLALSIHQNYFGKNGTYKVSGAETWYYANYESSRRIAKALIDPYCKETKIKNRGAKSDSTARFGALSWIREPTPFSALIECGFMSSKQDMNIIIGNFDLIARGIAMGICNVYKIPYIPKSLQEKPKGREEIKKEIIKLVNQL